MRPGTRELLRESSVRVASVSVILFFLASCASTAIQQSSLLSLNESGWGDSYVLYDVLHFQKTGTIYRDLSRPPYLAAQYSPLVYILYSIPGRVFRFSNAFLAPRVVALTAFLSCVLLVASIVRALIPVRFVGLWAVAMAGSIGTMRDWPLQLRGDFPGIFFDLLAMRLLFIPSGWAVIGAGFCAGFATQFKFTFVAGLLAGGLWLLLRRRWRSAVIFAGGGIVAAVGIYVLFWVHEHRMLQQILALSPGIPDLHGLRRQILQTAGEPVVLLAMLGISQVLLRIVSRWGLLVLFAASSFCIATLTDLQAGGNVNYFFETLFTAVPFAVLGAKRLMSWARQRAGPAEFVTVLFTVHLLVPQLASLDYMLKSNHPSTLQARDRRFRSLEDVLIGRHIFSTVPRIALLDRDPALMEPYLQSYLERLGKFDFGPLRRRLGAQEFDVVVTSAYAESWRGVPGIASDLRMAIIATYEPYCVYTPYLVQYLVHLPVGSGLHDAKLQAALTRIGCQPVTCNSSPVCQAW